MLVLGLYCTYLKHPRSGSPRRLYSDLSRHIKDCQNGFPGEINMRTEPKDPYLKLSVWIRVPIHPYYILNIVFNFFNCLICLFLRSVISYKTDKQPLFSVDTVANSGIISLLDWIPIMTRITTSLDYCWNHIKHVREPSLFRNAWWHVVAFQTLLLLLLPLVIEYCLSLELDFSLGFLLLDLDHPCHRLTRFMQWNNAFM